MSDIDYMPGIKRSSARSKGRSGEMEIIARLSNILLLEYNARKWPVPEDGLLHRGPHGKDIRGLTWLAPEIKRHEIITEYLINQWWKQCKDQAEPNAEPVLFYRNNHHPWAVRMLGRLKLSNGGAIRCPVDITFPNFLLWFTNEVHIRCDNLGR